MHNSHIIRDRQVFRTVFNPYAVLAREYLLGTYVEDVELSLRSMPVFKFFKSDHN